METLEVPHSNRVVPWPEKLAFPVSVVPWLGWRLRFLSEAGCAPWEQELGRCGLGVSRKWAWH